MKKLFSRLNYLDTASKNIMFFTFEGAVGAIILNMANPFFSMFARRIGANDYQIGLVSSLPALMGILAMIPGSIFVDKSANKKKIVSRLILLFGIAYPFAALTPYSGSYRADLFIIIIALMNWPYSVFNISWQSFFSDVMVSNFNSAFTRRTHLSTIVGTTTALTAGLLLSYFPKNDNERIVMYQLFFFLSFILAIIQSRLLNRVSVRQTRKPVQVNPDVLGLIKECFNNLIIYKDFRIFTLLAFIFHISWHMGWPLFFIYQVDVIGINEAWLSYVNVAIGFAGVITYSLWGKAIEKKGPRFVLIIGALGLSVNALSILLIHTKYMLLLQSTITGLTFSAFTLAIFENLIEVVPQKNKTINIAMYTTLINISQFISPLLGVWIYKQTSIVFALAFAGCLRLFATLLFAIRYIKGKKTMSSSR